MNEKTWKQLLFELNQAEQDYLGFPITARRTHAGLTKKQVQLRIDDLNLAISLKSDYDNFPASETSQLAYVLSGSNEEFNAALEKLSQASNIWMKSLKAYGE